MYGLSKMVTYDWTRSQRAPDPRRQLQPTTCRSSPEYLNNSTTFGPAPTIPRYTERQPLSAEHQSRYDTFATRPLDQQVTTQRPLQTPIPEFVFGIVPPTPAPEPAPEVAHPFSHNNRVLQPRNDVWYCYRGRPQRANPEAGTPRTPQLLGTKQCSVGRTATSTSNPRKGLGNRRAFSTGRRVALEKA
jgi:hypothetical protein